MGGVTDADAKTTLHHYLTLAREAVLWKLDGLSEYDVRRPLVPTGTNLLGLVKHLASVEIGYFGLVFGRPLPEEPPWFGPDAHPSDDLWATADERREDIESLYRRVWAHADATIEALPLDATGRVPWWPDDVAEVTLHTVLVHMIAETNRHAGHADIVREFVDGAAGHRPGVDNLAGEGEWFAGFHARVEAAARSFLPPS